MDNFIKFRNNFAVSVDYMYQWKTYCSVLEGVPDFEINQSMLDRLKEKTKRDFHVNAIYLVPPVQKTTILKHKIIAELPKITCMAKLSHYHPMSNEEMECSKLGLMWFQNSYAFPIDTTVVMHIEGLDWGKVSEDAYL